MNSFFKNGLMKEFPPYNRVVNHPYYYPPQDLQMFSPLKNGWLKDEGFAFWVSAVSGCVTYCPPSIGTKIYKGSIGTDK